MGEPLSRENRVFGQLRRFEEVFPDLEDVIVRFLEISRARVVRCGIFSYRSQGGQMKCGNRRCFRGGYELDSIVHDMVRESQKEREVTLRCRGDEGTPKRRRGDVCDRSIRATIMINPESSAATEAK
jgi:hypothetical protein